MDFEEIYTAYFQDVYRYIRKLSDDEALAEEITSECFFKALRSLSDFRGDSDIRVWLCQIAKNCYYTHLKKKKRTESLDALDQELPSPSENAEEHLLAGENAARIRKHLHELEEPYREVFMWRVFAELSFRQIGQIFGKSENWACVTYHRARNKIRERWEEET